jgi:hypothetical protein
MESAMTRSALQSSTADSFFVEPSPDDPLEPDRLLRLGDDQAGVPLEILAIEDARGDLIVIHAMKMRHRYRRQYEEALPWRIVR